jgi:hypothetical protein
MEENEMKVSGRSNAILLFAKIWKREYLVLHEQIICYVNRDLSYIKDSNCRSLAAAFSQTPLILIKMDHGEDTRVV